MSEPMTQCQRVARIVAELLSYPDAAWREKRAELEAAIQTVDDESMAAVLNAFVEHAFSCDAHEFEGRYVDAFDFSKETNLNLTSQSCKDERQQRMTLLGYSLYFENAGFTPGKELPDYLPSLLELSAAVDAHTAARILGAARGDVALLKAALDKAELSDYSRLVGIVLDVTDHMQATYGQEVAA